MTSGRSSGFVLMVALFLIVTFAAIGVYLVTIASGQAEAATQDEDGMRAYLAARAGIDWAAYQVLQNQAGTFAATTCTTPLAEQTLTLGSLGGPGGSFRAVVNCSRSSESESGGTVLVFLITATGCNRSACTAAGDPAYVERQLQLVITR